jgi:hypothetical protein
LYSISNFYKKIKEYYTYHICKEIPEIQATGREKISEQTMSSYGSAL